MEHILLQHAVDERAQNQLGALSRFPRLHKCSPCPREPRTGIATPTAAATWSAQAPLAPLPGLPRSREAPLARTSVGSRAKARQEALMLAKPRLLHGLFQSPAERQHLKRRLWPPRRAPAGTGGAPLSAWEGRATAEQAEASGRGSKKALLTALGGGRGQGLLLDVFPKGALKGRERKELVRSLLKRSREQHTAGGGRGLLLAEQATNTGTRHTRMPRALPWSADPPPPELRSALPGLLCGQPCLQAILGMGEGRPRRAGSRRSDGTLSREKSPGSDCSA